MGTVLTNFATAGLPNPGPAKVRIEKLTEVTAKGQNGETYQRLEGEFTVQEYGDGTPTTGKERVRTRFSLRPQALFRFRNLYRAIKGEIPGGSPDAQALADDLLGHSVWAIIEHTEPNEQGESYADLGAKFSDSLVGISKYSMK